MVSISLVANGALYDDSKLAPLILEADSIIAVDGGLCHLDRMGITPDLILGDFDSIPTQILDKYRAIPQKKYPREKDETDLELALQLAEHAKKISLFGALEKRTDHSLYNLHLLRRYPEKAYIQTEWETIFCVKSGCEIPVKVGQTVSFLPLDRVEGIRSEGLKWELDNHTLSISNIAKEPVVKITIEKGDLLCFLLEK